MEINGHTRLCGLIGNPVEHTLSPAIHNTLAQMEGHNLVYVPFHVEKEYLMDAVSGAYGLNILGMNVTVPYKSDVLAGLKEIDSFAWMEAIKVIIQIFWGFSVPCAVKEFR